MQQLKLTLKKSTIGRVPAHIQSVKGLGLRKINHSVIISATPENMGMVNQVRYLLAVEEC